MSVRCAGYAQGVAVHHGRGGYTCGSVIEEVQREGVPSRVGSQVNGGQKITEICDVVV